MDTYTLSNSTKEVGVISTNARKAYSVAIKNSDAKTLQALATAITSDLSLDVVKVKFAGNREQVIRANKPNKVKWAITEGNKVQVFKFYPTQKRVVPNSEAVKGLLYELVKAVDVQVLGLEKSIRTSGYYSRFADLTQKLAK